MNRIPRVIKDSPLRRAAKNEIKLHLKHGCCSEDFCKNRLRELEQCSNIYEVCEYMDIVVRKY